MYHAELSDIVVGGELKKRQHLSFKRMQEEQYQPKNFFKDIIL